MTKKIIDYSSIITYLPDGVAYSTFVSFDAIEVYFDTDYINDFIRCAYYVSVIADYDENRKGLFQSFLSLKGYL